jgi:lipopolysaccharide transport system permease protein
VVDVAAWFCTIRPPSKDPATMPDIASASELPHVRIRASEPGPLIDVPELVRFRDLLWTLAERDIKVRYKQTALGVIWVVLQPLLAALIFAFVFGVIARLPSDVKPYLVFAFAGMTAWNTFANVLTKVSSSLLSNGQMISKIYFPRLILPLSSVLSALVDSAFSLVLLFVMMAIYGVTPGWGIVFLPVWLLSLVVLALGLGLMASSWMVRYRDVAHIIPVVLNLGLFISPVAWSMSNPRLGERFLAVLRLNPLTSLLEAFRWSLFGRSAPPLAALVYALVVAVAVFWMGMMVFKQQERSFADVI